MNAGSAGSPSRGNARRGSSDAAVGLRLSVLVNNYNYGRFLRQCIDSVLAQTRPPHEVIVVDDGSTDSSLSVLDDYDGLVTVVRKGNGGQASAMNAAIARCTGDVACFLDSDDYWYENKLAAVAARWDENDDDAPIAMLRHDLDVVGEVASSRATVPGLGRARRHPATARERLLVKRYNAPSSALSIAAGALRAIGRVPEDLFRICADAYLYTFAAELGPIVDLPLVLGAYRVHDRNGFFAAGGDPARWYSAELALMAAAGRRGGRPVPRPRADVILHEHRLGLRSEPWWRDARELVAGSSSMRATGAALWALRKEGRAAKGTRWTPGPCR